MRLRIKHSLPQFMAQFCNFVFPNIVDKLLRSEYKVFLIVLLSNRPYVTQAINSWSKKQLLPTYRL